MYDLVIIGSGPAGLSAAVYAKRAGFHTLVLEKGAMSGGQVLTTYEVDNYLGMKGMNGFDLGMKFREHADHMGVEFLEAEAVSIEEGTESGVGEAAELVACEKTDPCIKPGRRAEAGGDKKGGRIYRIVRIKGIMKPGRYWQPPARFMPGSMCRGRKNWPAWGFLIARHATGLFSGTVPLR